MKPKSKPLQFSLALLSPVAAVLLALTYLLDTTIFHGRLSQPSGVYVTTD